MQLETVDGVVTIVPETDHDNIILDAVKGAEGGRVKVDSSLKIEGRQLEGTISFSVKQSAKPLQAPAQ